MTPFRVLLTLTLAIVAARIAVVRSPDGRTAFLSANDRSRWATVASLVEDGTYRIDRVIAIADPVQRHVRPFDSIDKVEHVGTDGRRHAYSSKPPLLATMVAAVYWPLHRMTGLAMTDHPIYVPRMILAAVNLPTLALLLAATWGSVRPLIRDDWNRWWTASGICLGTMLTPMAISLNNHLPAAAATAVALWVYVHGDRRWGAVAIAGAAAAMAVACELPALAMAAVWTGLFARRWFPFLTGAAVVAAAFFGTNRIAHQSWRMPYAHRGEGELVGSLDTSAANLDPWIGKPVAVRWFDNSRRVKEARRRKDTPRVEAGQIESSDVGEAPIVQPSDEPGRWRLAGGQRWWGVRRGGDGWEVRRWDDWYEYDGSYWQDGRRVGVDLGEPSRLRYAFHMLIGHHGVFSLTPIWLFSIPGVWFLTRQPRWRWLAAAIALVTAVCVAFYIARPLIDRNYGGVSSCFRWLLWLVPLWWVAVTGATSRWFGGDTGPDSPAADLAPPNAAATGARVFAVGLLAMSVFSVAVSLENPWVPPWIERWARFFGWV